MSRIEEVVKQTTEVSTPPTAERVVDMPMIPRRHFGRWIGAAFVLFILGAALRSLMTNERMEWHVVRDYFFHKPVLTGLLPTLHPTFWITVLGTVLGTLVALMPES